MSHRTFTKADYADDTTFLANTPAQIESQLHSRKQAAGGLSLNQNANNKVCICVKR